MRVALVHDWLTGMRGGEKCLEAMCRVWPQAHIYTLLHRRGAVSPLIEAHPIRTSFLQHLPGVFEHYRWFLPVMPEAVRRLRLRGRYDVVISLSHAVAKGVMVPPGIPHVCYCFTPMRWAWHCFEDYFDRGEEGRHARDRNGTEAVPYRDPRTRQRLGESASRQVARSGYRRLASWLLEPLRRWDLATADRVTHFVAISRTVAERIRECYGRESTVIYPPAATHFYNPGDVPREGFYVCVSALVPYKRVDLAIQACERLGRRLVILGSGPEEGRLRRLAGPQVRLLGWQPDAAVREYLRRCRALIFPGREDFGIVPVEAQACGTPIIAYGEGGATESVIPASEGGAGTGVLFFPQTAESVMGAMAWLERHPDRFSGALAREQAARFSTARFEEEIRSYVAAVVAAGLQATGCGLRPGAPGDAESRVAASDARRLRRRDTAHPACPVPRATSASGSRRHRSRAKKLLTAILLGVTIFCAEVPGARTAMASSEQKLAEINRRLSGTVLDFTQNHAGDFRVWSDALGQPRDLYVYLPPGFSRRNVYPLVVWLHGYGGDERQFLKQAVETLDQAIAAGELPPVIAAAPDGSLRGDFRLWGHGSWFTNSDRGQFEDYVLRDVMGFLQAQFPVDPDPRAHVAIGWSMGGFAAYKFGLRHPDRFKVLVGLYPNVNMRWCDRAGHYRTDFDPEIAGWMEVVPRWRLIGIVPDIHYPVTFNWAICGVWGHGREAARRLSAENPIELLDHPEVRPEELDLLIAYGKEDEYNVDAQVESFLHRARQCGLDVWVRYNLEGHHVSSYVNECLPDVWREVGVRLRRNESFLAQQAARGKARGQDSKAAKATEPAPVRESGLERPRR